MRKGESVGGKKGMTFLYSLDRLIYRAGYYVYSHNMAIKIIRLHSESDKPMYVGISTCTWEKRKKKYSQKKEIGEICNIDLYYLT